MDIAGLIDMVALYALPMIFAISSDGIAVKTNETSTSVRGCVSQLRSPDLPCGNVTRKSRSR